MELTNKIQLIKRLAEANATYIGTEIIHFNEKEYTPETFSNEMTKLFENVETEGEFENKFKTWLSIT